MSLETLGASADADHVLSPSATEPVPGSALSGDAPSRDTLYCSFCGKSQHEVERLIAGPTAFICDECVQLCSDIANEEVKARNDEPAVGCPGCGERIRMVAAVGRKQTWGITLRPSEGAMLQAATVAGAIDGAQKMMRLTCEDDGAKVQTYVQSISTAPDGSIAIEFATLPVVADCDSGSDPQGGDANAAPCEASQSGPERHRPGSVP